MWMQPILIVRCEGRHFTLCADSDSCHLFPVERQKKNFCCCDLLFCDFDVSPHIFSRDFLGIFWALAIHNQQIFMNAKFFAWYFCLFVFHCFVIIPSVFDKFPNCQHKGFQIFSTICVDLSQWLLMAAEAGICRVLYHWLLFLLLTFTDEFYSFTVRDWVAIPFVLY